MFSGPIAGLQALRTSSSHVLSGFAVLEVQSRLDDVMFPIVPFSENQHSRTSMRQTHESYFRRAIPQLRLFQSQ
jgi:hypothetical protein